MKDLHDCFQKKLVALHFLIDLDMRVGTGHAGDMEHMNFESG